MLLEQYYDLREKCFRKELGLPDFDGGEDERDLQGEIVIARQGDRCVGGARIANGSPRWPVAGSSTQSRGLLYVGTFCD